MPFGSRGYLEWAQGNVLVDVCVLETSVILLMGERLSSRVVRHSATMNE